MITIVNSQQIRTLELLQDDTTTITWYVQEDGADVTPSASSAKLVSGVDTVVLTTANASGSISATIPSSALTALGLELWDSCELQLEATISGEPVYHAEQCAVVQSAGRFPILYAWVTRRFPELADSYALPSGWSNFWPRIGLELTLLRNRLERQGAGRRLSNIRDGGLINVCMYAVWVAVADLQRQQQQRQSRYDQIYAELMPLYQKEEAAAVATFAQAAPTWGEEASKKVLQVKAGSIMPIRRQGYGGVL